MRLTAVYGALFLASGAGLLAVTYLLFQRATATKITMNGPIGPGPGAATDPLIHAARAISQQRALDLKQLFVQSGIALVVMAFAAVALGWFVAGRALGPVRTIIRAARDISASNLHERLALAGPDDELKELGDTFDALLERLEGSFRAQRHFVANASHELRTPLARQRTLIQVALSDPDATVESLRAAHERVLAANRQQERLIEALLALARSEVGVESHESVDLAELAHSVVAARHAEALERGLQLEPTLDPARTSGDPRLLERLIVNLVDNALRYNETGGRVEVRTGTGGLAVLEVLNTGPVIRTEDVGRMFQRFQRLGVDRTRRDGGLGLGLSIVHAIASAHGAHLDVEPRPEGGLRISVLFPSAGR